MLRTMLLTAALSAFALPLTAGTAVSASRPRPTHGAERPGIRIWTSHGEVYQRGERVRIYYRTERDAYVTILRVDTDGRIRVMYPHEPFEDNLSTGGHTYSVETSERGSAFYVDDDPGVGYIFAVASDDPFIYDQVASADHWDLHVMADGRIRGDPYSSLEELVQYMVPEGYVDFDTHLLPYYVEHRYDYPRFVCYDCHANVGFALWNPYRLYCPRFTLWIYTDPYYFYPSYWYPTAYYGGTRVVYVRPGQREGRFVFKTREASGPGITYRDRRSEPVQTGERRPADRGVRGVDVGGVGTVAAPGVPGSGRRIAPPGDNTAGRAGTPEHPLYVGPSDTRRRVPTVDGASRQPQGQSGATPEEGGRRRATGVPGVEIAPSGGRRGMVTDPGGLDRPLKREPAQDDAQARGLRPEVRPERGFTPPAGRDAPKPERPEEPRMQRPPESSRPEVRSAPPPRSEPRAAPRSAPPPRAEPRAAPAPRSAPRSSPPSPSLTRRRP
jgi:hypothetical protein